MHLVHSQAYLRLKSQSQESFNFIVLVCNAVPALNAYMKAVEHNSAPKIPDADYFSGHQSHSALRAYKEQYKRTLGRFVLITAFSYFESYIIDLLKEIVLFHGFDNVAQDIKSRIDKIVPDSQLSAHRKKIQKYFNQNKRESYESPLKVLSEADYPLPSDIFTFQGLKQIANCAVDAKARDIPDILESYLFFKFEQSRRERYHLIRDKRNEIAHGRVSEIDFKEAIEINNYLRDLALDIDMHTIEHFMIIDKTTFRGYPSKRSLDNAAKNIFRKSKPSHEEVSVAAYYLWLSQGRRDEATLDNWLKAEQTLILQRTRV